VVLESTEIIIHSIKAQRLIIGGAYAYDNSAEGMFGKKAITTLNRLPSSYSNEQTSEGP